MCDSFFNEIRNAPNTSVIREQTELLREEQNKKISEMWEPNFKTTLSAINTFNKEDRVNKAVFTGQEFLKITHNFSHIRGVRVFRDRVSAIIQGFITQTWQDKYNKLKKEIKELQTKRRFKDVILKLQSFLDELTAEDNIAIKQLRKKVERKLGQIDGTQIIFGRVRRYQTLVALAISNYEDKRFQKAINYMEEAIRVIKGVSFEKKDILLKDTGIIVKDLEFIFLCQDKITESKINEMVKKAKKLLKNGEESKAKSLLVEAQKQHNELSTLYQGLEKNKYRSLLQTIRISINQNN
ncbi:hypothetical protein ES703_77074 [subsurface metagenome]